MDRVVTIHTITSRRLAVETNLLIPRIPELVKRLVETMTVSRNPSTNLRKEMHLAGK
jgi:hypothetical protein